MKMFKAYFEPFLDPAFLPNVKNIRIGTRALSFWPQVSRALVVVVVILVVVLVAVILVVLVPTPPSIVGSASQRTPTPTSCSTCSNVSRRSAGGTLPS